MSVTACSSIILDQTKADADAFYKSKIEDLLNNLKDLEGIVQGKSNNLRMVEEGWFP